LLCVPRSYIERIQREKVNGASVHVGIDASKIVIVKLKIDKDRKRILELKARSRQVADKGKHTEEYIMETSKFLNVLVLNI
jgi:large subunit ribosomal protein L26e